MKNNGTQPKKEKIIIPKKVLEEIKYADEYDPWEWFDYKKFEPATDIVYYLDLCKNGKFNVDLYVWLIDNEKDEFEPLVFFNLLYQEFAFILSNPFDIAFEMSYDRLNYDRFDYQKLNDNQRLLLYNKLSDLLEIYLPSKSMPERFPFDNINEYLKEKRDEAYYRVYPELKPVSGSFNEVIYEIKDLSDVEKIRYLIDVKTRYAQQNESGSESNFVRQCELQIEKLEGLSALDSKERKTRECSINEDEEDTTLFGIFADKSIYPKFMNILVEKGYCQTGTYVWIDRKNGSKSFLAALLKYLNNQKYYRIPPTNKQIEAIIMNTFKFSVDIETVKKANPEKFEFDLGFIKPASTLS